MGVLTDLCDGWKVAAIRPLPNRLRVVFAGAVRTAGKRCHVMTLTGAAGIRRLPGTGEAVAESSCIGATSRNSIVECLGTRP